MERGAGMPEEKNEGIQAFPLLLKPVSFDCNLRCRYCFYLSKATLFGAGRHRMDSETLAEVTRRYLALPMEQYTFLWQGGEPTLAGVDFFHEAIRLQQRYSRGGRIFNAIQTNGTLLDERWGGLLRKNRFLVGISVDGPARLHDRFRLRADGGGSYREVVRGLGILKRHHVEFNALTLVSAANQEHPEEVYHHLKELGIRFQQYIECVEFDRAGRLQPFAVKPGNWGEFLCRIFDEWYREDRGKVSIRLFDSILLRLVTGVPTVCPMAENCCNYLVVEHNGDIYPCDFYVRPELSLGNIRTADFETLRREPEYRRWGELKQPGTPECISCRWYPLCMGDCPKNRTLSGSVLCNDWKLFFSHTIERFELLAAELCRCRQPVPRDI